MAMTGTRAMSAALRYRRLPLVRPSAVPSQSFGSSPSRWAEDAEADDAGESKQPELFDDGAASKKKRVVKGEHLTAPVWLNSPAAKKWKDPTPGRPNWLGGDIPFPQNPWFRPPAPLANSLRDKIYASFKKRVELSQAKSPSTAPTEEVMLRETSERWNISPSRVEAVIRLKAMEEAWVKEGKTMETNFEKAMESYLAAEERPGQRAEDVEATERRKQKRKARFYGIEFVDRDADPPKVYEPEGEEPRKPTRPARYSEAGPPSTERQITGPDGLPRPPRYWVSYAPNKSPIAFRDVSDFPKPKPAGPPEQRVSRKLLRKKR